MTDHKYKCEKCNFASNYKSALNKHYTTELHKTGKRKTRSDTIEPHTCNKCNYKNKNIIAYKKHMLNEHSNKETREKEFKYYCKYCDIGTFSKDTYNEHLETDKHKKAVQRNS
ncbi:hypothetical protein Klosneuvirus_4_82 [Klosneuvirus KNV1]|uniref:C2H2-type domain-containing protein n=1 Tax=Klosneuvirus KNV1 TaxID=1977640 RepID=A0A1V0SKL3_9VIRU|nr:hypothetical protein Klosneuvirus_4_82 [Klosneuvirus KNV1]